MSPAMRSPGTVPCLPPPPACDGPAHSRWVTILAGQSAPVKRGDASCGKAVSWRRARAGPAARAEGVKRRSRVLGGARVARKNPQPRFPSDAALEPE